MRQAAAWRSAELPMLAKHVPSFLCSTSITKALITWYYKYVTYMDIRVQIRYYCTLDMFGGKGDARFTSTAYFYVPYLSHHTGTDPSLCRASCAHVSVAVDV